MSELSVHIERLEPMRVATIAITSESPETESINALLGWARPQGLLDGSFRFFGYDNCQPHPNHTYTTWLAVAKDTNPSGDVEIIDFPGGRFAVTEVKGIEQIGIGWEQLVRWVADNGYAHGDQPGLEECLDQPIQNPPPDCRFRLYHSISD